MTTHLAQAASSGFHDAGAYDAYRPSYTDEAVTAFLDGFKNLSGGSNDGQPLKIVEIGAGTGKFTECLSRKASAGSASASPAFEITAVEPHEQMRAQLAAKNLPHVTVVDGHGADLGTIADSTADAVIVAQAFHW